MKKQTPLILSLYPNVNGLGYALIKAPQKLIEVGRYKQNLPIQSILTRIEKFIEFHQPTVIVVRDPYILHKRTKDRIEKLTNSLIGLAKRKKISVYSYTRAQIQDTFELFDASTKYDISQRIIHWFKELAIYAPKVRRIWDREDYNMQMFDAMALAITHLNNTQ